MSHLAILTADDCLNLRIVEHRIERTGRLDDLSLFSRKVLIFALIEYLREVKGYCHDDNISVRHAYVVNDNDIDWVRSKLVEEFGDAQVTL